MITHYQAAERAFSLRRLAAPLSYILRNCTVAVYPRIRTGFITWPCALIQLNCKNNNNNNNKQLLGIIVIFLLIACGRRRSDWSRGLRRSSAAARLLRLWVRIPPVAWMFVCCECCVLLGRGLCDELITRPEESYRL